MNKQYVGNDFAKAQTTDKLTPEKVGREFSLHSYHCYSYHPNVNFDHMLIFITLCLFFVHYRLLPCHFHYQYPILRFRPIVFLLLLRFPIFVILQSSLFFSYSYSLLSVSLFYLTSSFFLSASMKMDTCGYLHSNFTYSILDLLIS